jgi:hypothetical protein
MVMLPWLCFTIGVCEMGLLLHSSCETPFFTKTFVETFKMIRRTAHYLVESSQQGWKHASVAAMHVAMLPHTDLSELSSRALLCVCCAVLCCTCRIRATASRPARSHKTMWAVRPVVAMARLGN